jgi:methyl-accepting chemotaxis protein
MNMNLYSIRIKTLLSIMPLLLFIMVMLSWISYHYSYQIIETDISKQMALQTDATLTDFRSKLNFSKATGETIARLAEKIGDGMTKTQYAAFLQNIVPANEMAVGAGVWFEPFRYQAAIKYFGPYVYKDKGQLIYTEDYEKPDYDYPNQDWYKLATNTTQPVVWTEPYYDDVSKLTMLTGSYPFYDENKKLKGMATVDITISELQKSIAAIKVGEQGWAFLLDKNGNYLADKDATKIMKVKIAEDTNSSLAEAGKTILINKQGQTVFYDGNVRFRLYYAQMPETGWILALAVPEAQLYASLQALLFRQIVVAALAIVFVVIGIILYTRFIAENIDEVKRLSAIMADGDFREKITVTSRDEFGQMGQNFNHMIKNVRHLLHNLADNSQQVAAASQEFTANAQQTAKATEYITSSIQNIAQSMEIQAANAGQTTQALDEIAVEIAHINSKMQTVTDLTLQTAQKAVDGNKVVTQAIGQMSLISEKVSTATGVVDILGDKSREIDQIISLITSIAGQTNLLALNAAIEAARAGEQGKGFAVVAEEVRKLAEQSEAAANQISGIINEIQQETGKVVQIMGESTHSVYDGIALVNQAEATFQEIQEAISSVSGQSQDVAIRMASISQSTVQVVESVHSIADSTAQTSANIEAVAASTEEQNASMEEIQSAATMLAQLANELDKTVNLFKI